MDRSCGGTEKKGETQFSMDNKKGGKNNVGREVEEERRAEKEGGRGTERMEKNQVSARRGDSSFATRLL